MKRTCLPILLTIALFSLALTPAFAIKALVKVEGLNRDQIIEMSNDGYDIGKVGKNFVEVVLDTKELKDVVKTGLPHKVIIADLDKYVASILASQTKNDLYYTYPTMSEALKGFATKYPNICKLESIGKSFEKRDIWALKISDNPEKNEKEPAALIMGAHHSREWISFEVPMATIKALITGYGKDEKLTQLVNEREIWFVPMVNPDGVTYSQTKEKFWRKNRRKNADGSFGVDPNRNYGFQWGDVGASDEPSDDTYHGTGAFSEPETQAIRDFAKREKFSADITFHSYSELILFPWSYTGSEQCTDNALFAKFAKEMAEFNKYTPEQSSDLYPSMGDTDDFMYGECKSLSFTYELARTFIPAPTEIAKICAQNVPAVLYLIEKAGTYGLVTPSGEENISRINSRTAVTALKDLAPLANQPVVADRIQQLQKELARRVMAERAQNKSGLAELLSKEAGSNKEIQGALSLVKQLRSFENLHQKP